jgi:hypothetical protein
MNLAVLLFIPSHCGQGRKIKKSEKNYRGKQEKRKFFVGVFPTFRRRALPATRLGKTVGFDSVTLHENFTKLRFTT